MPQRLLFIALLLAIAACGSPEDDAPEHAHDTDADIETDAGTDADEVAIAVAPLTPGLFEMLPLTLSRPITTPGETLRVRLFEDVDDDGELNEAVDTLQTDAGGAPLDLSFEATHADGVVGAGAHKGRPYEKRVRGA